MTLLPRSAGVSALIGWASRDGTSPALQLVSWREHGSQRFGVVDIHEVGRSAIDGDADSSVILGEDDVILDEMVVRVLNPPRQRAPVKDGQGAITVPESHEVRTDLRADALPGWPPPPVEQAEIDTTVLSVACANRHGQTRPHASQVSPASRCKATTASLAMTVEAATEDIGIDGPNLCDLAGQAVTGCKGSRSLA